VDNLVCFMAVGFIEDTCDSCSSFLGKADQGCLVRKKMHIARLDAERHVTQPAKTVSVSTFRHRPATSFKVCKSPHNDFLGKSTHSVIYLSRAISSELTACDPTNP